MQFLKSFRLEERGSSGRRSPPLVRVCQRSGTALHGIHEPNHDQTLRVVIGHMPLPLRIAAPDSCNGGHAPGQGYGYG